MYQNHKLYPKFPNMLNIKTYQISCEDWVSQFWTHWCIDPWPWHSEMALSQCFWATMSGYVSGLNGPEGSLTQWPFQEPKLEVPTIYKAYVREYSPKIWPYMVQYLHFRILKFPLIASPFRCENWGYQFWGPQVIDRYQFRPCLEGC